MSGLEDSALRDPILFTYRVAPYLFDIGDRLWPVSIRDQMIRAQTIVDRAARAKLIGPGRPLLVIGAGAGGATAAVAAAKRKIETLLVEKERAAFGVQAGCLTRVIDPTQYDWPLRHWHRANSAWNNDSLSLNWTANTANAVAAQWRNLLIQYDNALPHLSIKCNHLGRLPPLENLVNLVIKEGEADEEFVQASIDPYESKKLSQTISYQPFGMILTCRGLEDESHVKDECAGFKFWDRDHWGRDETGNAGSEPSVLISGAGDGGLQDLLRILTYGRSARDILFALMDPADISAWQSVRIGIGSAEDQAQRAYSWSGGKVDDCDVLTDLERVYDDAITYLKASNERWSRITDNLQQMLNPGPCVSLVRSCTHFARCYGLNHLLARILMAYFEAPERGEQTKQLTTYSGFRTHSIQGMDDPITGVKHRCRGIATDCHNQPHKVVLSTSSCHQQSNPAVFTKPLMDVFNVVVIRHGFKPYVHDYPLIRIGRHMLPYYLPSPALAATPIS